MIRFTLAVAALALLAAGSAHAIGRAEVSFVKPEKFADAGFGSLEIQRNLKLVTDEFERLARRLPDGQVLKVEVTDLDLAGEVDTLSMHRIRVMGQLPDAPRLSLRFELLKEGRVLAAGQDHLIDMAYALGASNLSQKGPLPYEARMLERWFNERLAGVR